MTKLIEVSIPCQNYAARLHAEGCSDIAKDKRKGYTEVWPFNGTVAQWKIDSFGDVASDSFDSETERDEWLKEIDYQASEVTVAGCCKAAGLTD